MALLQIFSIVKESVINSIGIYRFFYDFHGYPHKMARYLFILY